MYKKIICIIMLICLMLSACKGSNLLNSPTMTPKPTADVASPTPTPTVSPKSTDKIEYPTYHPIETPAPHSNLASFYDDMVKWLGDRIGAILFDGSAICDLNGDGEVNQLDLNILWQPMNYNKGAVVINL